MIERSRSARTIVGALLLVAGLASMASAQPAEASVIHLSLEGVVDPFVADYLRNGIEGASEADAVLLTIDTPGGLDSSMREIIKAIQDSRVPVLCYVAPEGARAASAGAFILVSCHVAAMAPATAVGASTPVGIGGVTLSRKIEEDAAAYMRTLAQQRGRNADLASRFVTRVEEHHGPGGPRRQHHRPDRELGSRVCSTQRRRHERRGRGRRHRDVAHRRRAIEDVDDDAGRGVPPRSVRPEPRVHLLLARSRADRPRADRARAHLQRHGRHDPAADRDRVVRAPARAADRDRAARRLRGVLRGRAEGARASGSGRSAGIVSLVLGGLFLFDPSGGVEVSPLAIVARGRRSWHCSSGSWSRRRSRCGTCHRRREPRPSSAGRAWCSQVASIPKAVVRVAAEEWRAIAGTGSIPEGTTIRVTKLDGLVLTVEPLDLEHAPTGGAAPARRRNT